MRGFRFRGRFGPQSSPWWRTRPHTATEGAGPEPARSTTAQGTQRQLPSAMLLPAGACPMSMLLERAASHLQRPVGSQHRLLVCHAQPPPGPRHCQTNGCVLGTRPKYQHSVQSHRFCNETVTMDDRPTQTLVLGSHLFAMRSASETIARPRGGPGNDRKIVFVASSGPGLCWSAAYKPAMSPAHADTTQCDRTVQLPVHDRPRHLRQLDL